MPLINLDPASAEAFGEWMQRPPHISGLHDRILVIKQPNFPQFRFEWHPQAKKVYLVRTGRIETIDGEDVFVPLPANEPMRAERLAEHVESHGEAHNFVQTFLRGFREGRTPNLFKPHLEG